MMESSIENLNITDNDDFNGNLYFESNSASSSIKDRFNLLIQKHNDKVADAEQRLKNLKKRKPKALEELPQHLELIEAERLTLLELNNQKREFENFSNNLLALVDSLGEDDVDVVALIEEFSLECKRFESGLPIYSNKSEILDTISKHQVTIITAETGSGKSTQIVQYIHQQCGGNQMIVCTQPRKVAAISLAKRVSEEMETNLGKTVGYRVGTSSMVTENTCIYFVTDHFLLNECLADRNLQKYKYIIVDEAHERSIPTDLLLAMLKKALDQRPELRLIISSATIDPAVFKDFFQQRAACLHVHGRTFPVQVIYEDVSVGNNYLQESVRKTKQIHEYEKEGDILVFLTTPGETEKAQEMIEIDKTLNGEIYCLVLHGRLTPEEQQRIFEPAPTGLRKIVFATNSAETSITIPNIRYVVDSGMVKEKHYDKDRNISLLRVGPVNKSSATQRKGRAGRTQEGKCFRLYTEEEYRAMMDEMLPEILRENLGIALLKLYQLGIEDPLHYDFVQPPSEKSLRLAQDELYELGGLENNRLTRYGEIMATLGVEPKLAKFVALAIDDDIGVDAMVIAAICSIGSSVFFRAGTEDEKQNSDRLKVRFCKEQGDMITILEVFKEWFNIIDRGYGKNIEWCVDNSMNAKTLRYTKEMVSEMIGNVNKLLGTYFLLDDFADYDEVIQKVPRLLSECFAKNVAYFSGHVRGGYYIPNKGKERFHLHPSAALSYLNITPKWLLFTEVLCTSRTYIINTSVLPDHIGEALFGKINVPRINRQKEWVVGKGTARQLGFGRLESRQEHQMQKKIDENIYIEFDTNVGKVTLYCEDSVAVKAISELEMSIGNEKIHFDRKIYEVPISDGNPTTVVLKKGGRCNEILEQGQYNAILLRRLQEKVSKEDVEEEFRKFGPISDVIQFNTTHNDTWGKVIYRDSESAAKAVKDFRGGYGIFRGVIIKPAWRIESNQTRQQNYTVKAHWTRLPAKGNYGFIELQDPNMNSVLIGQTIKIGNSTYQFQKAKKGNDLMVKGITSYTSNEEIKLGIENQCGVKIKQCKIPRSEKEIESKDVLQAIKNQLCLHVARQLGQEARGKRTFFVRMKPVQAKSMHNHEASIHFKSLKSATAVAKSNITMGTSVVYLQLEKKSPELTVPKEVYRFVKDELNKKLKGVQHVKLNVFERKTRDRKKQSNEVQIEISSDDLESLSKGRDILYDLVFGECIKFTEDQFRYFSTPNGKTFIEGLEVQKNCLIKMDPKIRSLILYSPMNVREELKGQIERKRELNQRYAKSWNFDLNGRPNGFIKFLTKRYGVRLTELYGETDASYININFFHHRLEVYGTSESLLKAKDILDDLAEELGNTKKKNIASGLTECPVCRDTLETTSYQLETCCHSYCKECIQAMCKYAAQNKQLPLKCVHVGCDFKISIENILDLTEIDELVPAAVELFVAENGGKYNYCINPNCVNVYTTSTTSNPDPYECGLCQIVICRYCHVEYHDDVPCRINSRTKEDGLKEWLEEDPTKRGLCPKCSAPIELAGGCNEISCPVCKLYVCWRCKKECFKALTEYYTHMVRCRR